MAGKTGGGRGTNQYQVQGTAKAEGGPAGATPPAADLEAASAASDVDPLVAAVVPEDPLSNDALQRNGSVDSTVRWSFDDSKFPRGGGPVLDGFLRRMGVRVTRDKSGGELGPGVKVTTFTSPLGANLTAAKLAEELGKAGIVTAVEPLGDETNEPNEVMLEVERRRVADGGNDPLADRLARVSPRTLESIIKSITYDERQRALAAIEGRPQRA